MSPGNLPLSQYNSNKFAKSIDYKMRDEIKLFRKFHDTVCTFKGDAFKTKLGVSPCLRKTLTCQEKTDQFGRHGFPFAGRKLPARNDLQVLLFDLLGFTENTAYRVSNKELHWLYVPFGSPAWTAMFTVCWLG